MKDLESTVVALCIVLCAVGCAHKETKSSATAAVVGGGDSPPSIALDPAGSDGKKIDGLESVHFSFDGASVQKAELALLKSDASWMLAHPRLKIQIEGHCDSRGSVEYNLALGERRAKSVADYLRTAGVPAEKLSTISYGKEKPLDTADTEDAFAKNRRVNFVPVGQ